MPRICPKLAQVYCKDPQESTKHPPVPAEFTYHRILKLLRLSMNKVIINFHRQICTLSLCDHVHTIHLSMLKAIRWIRFASIKTYLKDPISVARGCSVHFCASSSANLKLVESKVCKCCESNLETELISCFSMTYQIELITLVLFAMFDQGGTRTPKETPELGVHRRRCLFQKFKNLTIAYISSVSFITNSFVISSETILNLIDFYLFYSKNNNFINYMVDSD